MVPCVSWWRAALVAVVLVVLPASAAWAHPFVRGGELAVESLASMTLAMAHGCGSEDAGAGAPTAEVALEVPDWLRVVEVHRHDGWIVDVERSDDGRVEVVVWIAEEPIDPAPEFGLDVVATGEPGETRHLRVMQACEDAVHRWVGTPDEPADEPAVRVVLAAPDPAAPPPPEPPAGDDDADAAPGAEEADAPEATGSGDRSDAPPSDPEPSDAEPSDPEPAGAEPERPAGTAAAEDGQAAGGGPGALVWAAAALVALVVGLAIVRARRRGSARAP